MATGAIILGSIAAAGTAYSAYQQRKAGKAQKRAAEVQRKQRLAEEARSRRQQITEARRKRAAIINATSAGGLSGGSGEAESIGSVQSQLGGNLGFMEQSSNRSRMFENFANKANAANTRAATGGAVASLAMQGVGMFSGSSGGGSQMFSPRQAGPSSPLFDTPGPNPRSGN